MANRMLELRQKRANLVAQAREVNEVAEKEARDLTAEEEQRFSALMDEADTLRKRIEREERMVAFGDEEDEPEEERRGPVTQPNGNQSAEERQMNAFRRFLPNFLAQDFRNIAPRELRALQAELDTTGGFLRPPMQFINDLLKDVDNEVMLRQWATKFSVVSAESMGVPTLETDASDAAWTSELATGAEDTAMAFGRRELHPHPLAKRIKISKKLLRSVPSVDSIVRQRLAYKFGITEEQAFMTGSGAQQPLGVFTAHANGIPTTRDVSTDNTATAITSDNLKNAKYTLKGQYWRNARWLFHRDAVKMIAKLKDGEGQYIWTDSIVTGDPDRLLGFPVYMSEYVPNTFTSALYVGLLGDFSYYWIADALTLEFQVLNELYAETNQVGLIGRLECDGAPVMAEAFVRVKLG